MISNSYSYPLSVPCSSCFHLPMTILLTLQSSEIPVSSFPPLPLLCWSPLILRLMDLVVTLQSIFSRSWLGPFLLQRTPEDKTVVLLPSKRSYCPSNVHLLMRTSGWGDLGGGGGTAVRISAYNPLVYTMLSSHSVESPVWLQHLKYFFISCHSDHCIAQFLKWTVL